MVEKYINGLFNEWGIRFIGLVDNADTEVKGNKKSRQINGLVNEWYLEDLSDNIKSILKSKREKEILKGITGQKIYWWFSIIRLQERPRAKRTFNY